MRHTFNLNWKALWQTVIRVETNKINPWIALRNTIGVVCPLVLGLWCGQLTAGLVVSLGALNVTFADGKDPYQQRARRMVLASLFCGLAVIVGATTGRDAIASTLVATWWAFGAGMAVALGSTPGDTGTVSLVVLVVFAAQPMEPHKAMLSGLLAFAGGLFQTTLSIVSWFLRPYEPERRVLGALYGSLKRMIEEHVDASESPPATAQSNEASKALATLERDYSLEGERYRSLLNQAERARLSILAIKRLRARLRREVGQDQVEPLNHVLAIAARVCGEVSRLLQREVVSIHVAKELDQLHSLEKGLTGDPRVQVAALAGQLRAAVSLASHSIGAGRRAFERQEARKPLALRLTSSLAILRANLSLDSAVFRHAVRLAVCIAAGVAIGRSQGLLRPYWIPMTIALVLKPDFSTTFSRGVLRLAGTYAGLGIATELFHLLHPAAESQIALLAVVTILYRCFGPANYGILTATVSALVVLLIALAGVSPRPVIVARAINTTIGGLLALSAYTLWPTWERRQLPEAMAALLDAYRQYYGVLMKTYLDHEQPEDELDNLRLAARLARSNLEAAVERYRAEPGASPDALQRIMAMLASSHRFAHALMTIEAELAANPSRSLPPASRDFFDAVYRTQGLLVNTLRGSRPTPGEFPDLRDAHTHLLVSIGSEFVLLATETDRIANSLNTLREQITAWPLVPIK
jgi:uncharacterized membrane protein YccC